MAGNAVGACSTGRSGEPSASVRSHRPVPPPAASMTGSSSMILRVGFGRGTGCTARRPPTPQRVEVGERVLHARVRGLRIGQIDRPLRVGRAGDGRHGIEMGGAPGSLDLGAAARRLLDSGPRARSPRSRRPRRRCRDPAWAPRSSRWTLGQLARRPAVAEDAARLAAGDRAGDSADPLARAASLPWAPARCDPVSLVSAGSGGLPGSSGSAPAIPAPAPPGRPSRRARRG